MVNLFKQQLCCQLLVSLSRETVQKIWFNKMKLNLFTFVTNIEFFKHKKLTLYT